jgi:DNA-binding winged-HTH domains
MLWNSASISIQYGASTQIAELLPAAAIKNAHRPQGIDTVGFAFGSYLLVPQRHLLLHDGVPVSIGSRAFAILHELVRRAGDLVFKNDLLGLAWPSTFVDEANLRVQIAGIRRALSAHGDGAGFIVNVPGRGYKFVEPVSRVSSRDYQGLPARA